MHRDDAAKLRLDLLDDLRLAGGHNGDAAEVAGMINFCDCQAVDVVAAPRK